MTKKVDAFESVTRDHAVGWPAHVLGDGCVWRRDHPVTGDVIAPCLFGPRPAGTASVEGKHSRPPVPRYVVLIRRDLDPVERLGVVVDRMQAEPRKILAPAAKVSFDLFLQAQGAEQSFSNLFEHDGDRVCHLITS